MITGVLSFLFAPPAAETGLSGAWTYCTGFNGTPFPGDVLVGRPFGDPFDYGSLLTAPVNHYFGEGQLLHSNTNECFGSVVILRGAKQ